MSRTLRRGFGTAALASGVVLGLVASPTHAQAPVRPASGSQYQSTRRPATPAPTAVRSPALAAAAPSGGYYYPSPAATPATPPGGYYYQPRAAGVEPSGYYYPAPAPTNPGRGYYYSNPASPARVRSGPAVRPRSVPQPPSGFDEDYAYKS